MAFHDLRTFLERLRAGGRLRRVAEPIDPDLESTAFCLRTQRAQGPALLFEHPLGSPHALLGNLFGDHSRIEAALAGRPLSSLRELGELLAAVKEPRWPGSLRQALAAWPEFAQLAHVAPRRHRVRPCEATAGLRRAQHLSGPGAVGRLAGGRGSGRRARR